MLPLLLRVLDARAMTGSEAQRKLLLGHATLLAYCLRWQDFRARARRRLPNPDACYESIAGLSLHYVSLKSSWVRCAERLR
jgi:hypothetical protein